MTENQAIALCRIEDRISRRKRNILPLGGCSSAAVAIPLLAEPQGPLKVLLTLRTDRVEHHKGEISFPGGRQDDADPDALAAALRETWEEVGIPAESFRLLGALDDFVSISNYRVTPFVLLCEKPVPFSPAPAEVAEVLTVPLRHLLNPAHYRFTPRPDARFPDAAHTFCWNHHRIWGLTGAILHHFLELSFDFPSTGAPGDV